MKSHTTVLFDKELVDTFPIILDNELLENWLKEPDQDKMSVIACRYVANAVIECAKELLTSSGQKRLVTLTESLHQFERIIENTRTTFARKIYRDHVNHVLRTALLASLLADLCKLTKQQIRGLITASLLHDAAYPVQEGSETLTLLSNALKGKYSTVSYSPLKTHFKKTIKGEKELCLRVGLTQRELRYFQRKRNNHAVISALEFLECCKDTSEESLDIAAAICLHDSDIKVQINYNDNPLAVLLILADELQDWGRPAATPNQPRSITLDEIEKWETSALVYKKKSRPNWKHIKTAMLSLRSMGLEPHNYPAIIKGEFRYQEQEFPILDVIYAKYQNFRRIRIQQLPLFGELIFPLTHYTLQTYIIHPFEHKVPLRIKTGSYTLDLEMEKKGKHKPWRFWIGRHTWVLSDRELADLIQLGLNDIVRAKKAYRELKTIPFRNWHRAIPFSLYELGNSNDFIVHDGRPEEIRIRFLADRLDIHLTSEKWGSRIVTTGELVKIQTKSPFRNQPLIFKVIPIIVRILQVANNNWAHPLTWADCYWVDPEAVIQRV